MNQLGKPQWINRRKLVRTLQTALGGIAGLFLFIGGLLWGLWSDDKPIWLRLLVTAIAFLAGLGLGIWIGIMAWA